MLKVGTLFSGIGAAEYALKNMGIDYEVVFAGDIDKFVKKTYFANYKMNENKWHNDITEFDATPFEGQVDLLIGGSPCQAFSSAGKQLGFEDTRGTLFFEYARILNECKPKAFIFENVRNLVNHDKGKTFEVITNTFKELGYKIHYQVLNASDYGIPQTRRRIFIVGFKDIDEPFLFPDAIPLTATVQDLLESEIDEKYFLNQGFIDNYVFAECGSWNRHPEVNKPIASTLTTKMGSLRASQDNYQTLDGRLRKLTPREGLRLMGYGDDFKIVCSNTQMYKQIGNSIVVNVIGLIIENVYQYLNKYGQTKEKSYTG